MLIPTIAEAYSWNAFAISKIKHGIRIIGAKNPLRNLHSLKLLTDTLTIHICATIPHLHFFQTDLMEAVLIYFLLLQKGQ